MNTNKKVVILQRSNVQRKTESEYQQQQQQEEVQHRQNRSQQQQQRQNQQRAQIQVVSSYRTNQSNQNTKIMDQEQQQDEQAILNNEMDCGNYYVDNQINYYDDDDDYQVVSLNENSFQPIQRTMEEEQQIFRFFEKQIEKQCEKQHENENTYKNKRNQNYQQMKHRITPEILIQSVYSNDKNNKLQNVKRILSAYGEGEFTKKIDDLNFDNSVRNRFETLLDLHYLLVNSREAGNMFYVKEIWVSKSMLLELEKAFNIHSYNHTSDRIVNFYQQLLDSFQTVIELDPKQEYLPISQTKKQIQILLKRNDHDVETQIQINFFCDSRQQSFNYFNKISKLDSKIDQIEQQQLEYQIEKQKKWIKEQEQQKINQRILKMAGVNITYKYCPSTIDIEDLLMRTDDHPAFGDIIPASQKEGYYSVPLYLNNNFYLLREDYLRDFRKSIKGVLMNGIENVESQSTQNFNVYKTIKVKRVKISTIAGFRFKIKLKTYNNKCVDWTQTTRLMAGSLLYIVHMDSPNRNLQLSIIQRESEDYSHKVIIWVNMINRNFSFSDVQFLLEIQQTERAYIFENKIFYESYIYYLNCIKDKDENDFPFTDQLVLGKNNSIKPIYHKEDHYYYNMEFSPSETAQEKTRVSIYQPWPTDLKSTLDDSQLKAVKQILTNGISLIQGPPGTGKTYCGALALKNLINNKPNRHKSIIIVCYTNHALDQFLNHMLEFIKIQDMVRVGGRCQDKKIQECCLQLVTKDNNNLDWEFYKKKDFVSKGVNCYFGLPPMDQEEILRKMERKRRRAMKMGGQFDSQWALDSDEENDRRSYIDIENDDDDPQNFRFPRRAGHVELYESDYNDLQNQLWQAKRYKIYGDIEYMNQKKIIGLTVTGCAKYANLLEKINYDTLVIEEAAEVLECHTAAILSKKVEHLILIGDHLQLKPKLESYYLETKYQTNISLFERLVNNNYPCVTLTHQRRMKSKFADFIRLIYGENYKDHNEVIDQKNNIQIKGLEDDLIFFDHQYEEDQEQGRSKSNTQEAQMITNLVEYLVLNNHLPKTITVLGMYIKQLILIKRMLKSKSIEDVIVKSVDNYQGEENDIIILSLVRSNQEGKLGFTAIDNRICVALSRVRLGLYVFGNFTFIYESIKQGLQKQNSKFSDLWLRIIDLAKQKGVLKTQFSLICQNHKTISKIAILNDWKITNFGGCSIDCNQLLACGHKCQLKCHSVERHSRKFCSQLCENVLDCGHKCQKMCKDDCGQCQHKVEKQVPQCGHNVTIECSRSPSTNDCKELTAKLLECSHTLMLTCYQIQLQQNNIWKEEENNICKEMIVMKLKCNHEIQIFCYESKQNQFCKLIITKDFRDCKHTFNIECGKSNNFNCTQIIQIPQICGHNSEITCHEAKLLGSLNFDRLECSDRDKKCQINLECGHKCTGQCKQPCPPCCQIVTNLKCGHECSTFSHVYCNQQDQYQCKYPINNMKLKCGHPMLCYLSKMNLEDYKCKKIVQVLTCEHKANIYCFKQKTYECKEVVKKTLKCGHNNFYQCSKDVNLIVCKSLIQKQVPCGHINTLSVECGSGLCLFPMIATFNYCNHDVIIPCYQFNDQIVCDICVNPLKKKLDCGHEIIVTTDKKYNQLNCEFVLNAQLECGHMQLATCSEVKNNSVMCLYITQTQNQLTECNVKNYCYQQKKQYTKNSLNKAKYLQEIYQYQFENGVNYFIKEVCDKRFDCGHSCQSYFWECHCIGAHQTCKPCQKQHSNQKGQIYQNLNKNIQSTDYIIGVYSNLQDKAFPQTILDAIIFQVNWYKYILDFGEKQFFNPQVQKLKDNIFMIVSANQLLNNTLNFERMSNFAIKYQLFMNLDENNFQYKSLLQNSSNYSSRGE